MYDLIIIGAGLVGSAVAYYASQYELKVLVLEKENDVAMGTSRANSAIIHGGYDPEPGTLMARLNVAGTRMAQELCARLDVEYVHTGALVIAFSESEMDHVRKLYERGVANGLDDLEIWDREQLLAAEPRLSPDVIGALHAPTAGVINPWDYAMAFAQVAVRHGVELLRRAEVTAIEPLAEGPGYRLTTPQGVFEGRRVVNAAGVEADRVEALFQEPRYRIRPTRGDYYLIDKTNVGWVNKIIFQCPNEQGKGVLVSPTIHGNILVGPNAVLADSRQDVGCTAEGLAEVREKALRSTPNLPFRDNIRCFAGMRANSTESDFIIEFAAPAFLNLSAIRSPGLSAAPAIGLEAIKLLAEDGLELKKREHWDGSRKKPHVAHATPTEVNALCEKDPRFGRIICRCETISEGEIVHAIHDLIPPCSVDGIKRRCGTGMGRCQGGFCAPRIVDILCRELGLRPEEVLKDGDGSWILCGETKQAPLEMPKGHPLPKDEPLVVGPKSRKEDR